MAMLSKRSVAAQSEGNGNDVNIDKTESDFNDIPTALPSKPDSSPTPEQTKLGLTGEECAEQVSNFALDEASGVMNDEEEKMINIGNDSSSANYAHTTDDALLRGGVLDASHEPIIISGLPDSLNLPSFDTSPSTEDSPPIQIDPTVISDGKEENVISNTVSPANIAAMAAAAARNKESSSLRPTPSPVKKRKFKSKYSASGSTAPMGIAAMAAAAARQKMALKGAIEEYDTSDLYTGDSSTTINQTEVTKTLPEDPSVNLAKTESIMHSINKDIPAEISSTNDEALLPTSPQQDDTVAKAYGHDMLSDVNNLAAQEHAENPASPLHKQECGEINRPNNDEDNSDWLSDIKKWADQENVEST